MPNNTRQEWIEERTAVLAESTNLPDLELAATELAFSDDPEALKALAAYLGRAEFLDRLDPPESPDGKAVHLYRVLSPLIQRPSPEVVSLCLTLADEPVYLENDRKSFLLEALAVVTPMKTETAEAFRRANEEGYFAFDALLLAANGSPVALDLFASMMSDKDEDIEARIELLHKGIVPYRNRFATLQMVAALMAADLEEPVTLAAIESVFDYRKEWFTMHGPMPPGWRTASGGVLQLVIDLGVQAKKRPDLPEPLSAAIDETTDIVRALLAARSA